MLPVFSARGAHSSALRSFSACRVRDAVGAVVGVAQLTGCYTTHVTSADKVESFKESRSKAEPSAQSVSAEWKVEERTIVGKIKVGKCKSSRSWTVVSSETTEKQPNKSVGYAFMGAGALTSAVGSVLLMTGRTNETYSCSEYQQDCVKSTSPAPYVLLGSGAVLALTGLVLNTLPEEVETKETSRQPHSKDASLACIQPGELRRLRLGVAIGPEKYIGMRVSDDGSTRATLPDTLQLPSGESLPIVVLEPPSEASAVLTRGEVVGTLVVP
jgi:hypothetical protein